MNQSKIDIPRAFTFAFDDPQVVSKLLMTGLVTLASVALTPLIIGIAGFAILFGYQVELMRNIRDKKRYVLPAWGDLGRLFSLGLNPLIAWVAYNVPNLVIGLVIAIIGLSVGDGLLSGGLVTLALCCFVPLLIVYNIAIQPVFALGMGRYADDAQHRLNAFFDLGALIALVRGRTDLLVQWLLGMIIASILLGLVNGVPCVGWAASLALTAPILGHLNGQYAAAAIPR